ncbi:hypothetical protein HY837_02255 [archaeon]|nr:hypothetical protein [archaeon]
MLNKVNNVLSRIELRKPENRRILEAYTEQEAKDLEQVYTVLEVRFPSLKDYIARFRDVHDPVSLFNEAWITSKVMGNAGTIVDGLEAVTDSLANMFKVKNPKNVFKNLKQTADQLEPLGKAIDKVVAYEEPRALNVAKSVKEISETLRMDYVKVVQSRELRDAVWRKVFNDKSAAEAYIEGRLNLTGEVCDAMRGLTGVKITLPKQVENLFLKMKKVPTKQAMDAFNQAVTEFYSKEFERIYA